MLNKLICKAVGHVPWVHSSVTLDEVDGSMEVYLKVSKGQCKRCDAVVAEDPQEILAYRFHPAELDEPVKLTQRIDRFE